mgnify:CR=1 FL=1
MMAKTVAMRWMMAVTQAAIQVVIQEALQAVIRVVAPVALQEAEGAVLAAEQLRKDEEQEQALGQHLVVMADRKVEIAKALAQTRLYEDQRKALSTQREGARLDSRTLEANQAQQQNARLQQQLDEMNAKQTERGLVMTLGDVLFDTGRADLKNSASRTVLKLVQFLQLNPRRVVRIEGYTDSTGTPEDNLTLSRDRAQAVADM